MAEVIFLLGAGASKDAGLPLMADLTEGFPDWLRAKAPAATKPMLEVFEAATRLSAGGTGSAPNIEHVLELLADVNSLKTGAGAAVVQNWASPFDAQPAVFEGLSLQVRTYIRETLSKVAPKRGDYLHGLLDFAGEEPVDVFTMNYDRLVENMAVCFDVRHTTGFGETWDPRLFALEGLRLRLFKLHGSIDWFRLLDRNVVFRGSDRHPAFPESQTSDVLLYPTRGKDAFADPYATLLSFFSDALGRTRFCAAIGYSFRDPHIRRTVLDRMATNPDLQLLLVDPNASVEIERRGDEGQVDEPSFADVRDRVSVLVQEAKYALENRTIRDRLDEIARIDHEVRSAVENRNARGAAPAVFSFIQAVDYGRMHHLPYKPHRFLREAPGHELREHLAAHIQRRLSEQADTLRIPLKPDQDNWKDVGPDAMASAVGLLVSDWLLAAALGLDQTAQALRESVRAILQRYAAGLLFIGQRSWQVWGSPYPHRAPKTDLDTRRSQLRAVVQHLRDYPPITGLSLAKGAPVAQEYQVLGLGLRALIGVHERLLEHPVALQKVYGVADVLLPQVGNWHNAVSIISGNFLACEAPETWLGPPTQSGST